MDIVEFPNDRTVISTENNGFAGGERDENLIDEELLETEIPLDDRIPDAAHEDAENDRPVYDEEGYRYDPGGESKIPGVASGIPSATTQTPALQQHGNRLRK